MNRLGSRYILVGLWNTFFGLGNFYLLLWLIGESHYIIVLTVSYCLSILQAHFSQRFFVWHSGKSYFRELSKFSTGYVLQYFLNLILLHLAVKSLRLDLRWSQLVVAAILIFIGFFINRKWVFGAARPSTDGNQRPT
jgi:putative flippase GtrA